MLDVVLSLMSPLRRHAGPQHDLRCATRAPAELSPEGRPVANLVFLGDSISFRTLNAASCDLRAHGATEARIPRDHRHGRVYRRVHAHPAYATVKSKIQHKYGEHYDLETISERVFTLPLEPLTASSQTSNQAQHVHVRAITNRSGGSGGSGGNSSNLVEIRLVGLWRSGSTLHGPGMVGEAAMPGTGVLFDSLMDSFGSCTAVIYNEGLVRVRPFALWLSSGPRVAIVWPLIAAPRMLCSPHA